MTMENDLVERLQRYGVSYDPDDLGVNRNADGEWVRYSDAATAIFDLQSTVQKLVAAGNDDVALMQEMGAILTSKDARIQALEAELAQARKERDAALDHDWVAAPAYAAKVTMCREFRDRAERAEAELARKTEALDRVAEWARAYPLSVFPEPDFAKVRELLWAGGIMIDAVSASNMRHVITQVASIARSALEEKTDV